MRLSPGERDRLEIFLVAQLARARRDRGLRLNAPEATALVADAVVEAARDGARLEDAVSAGMTVLGPDDVLPGVRELVRSVHVEAVFDDGTRLAVVDDPIGGDPSPDAPGTIVAADADAPAPTVAADATVEVENTASVAISVTSHLHFFEANPRLRFPRRRAYGRRLAIPAGEHVRFDPGTTTRVDLTPIGGARVLIGFAGLVDGALDDPGVRAGAYEAARSCGYLDSEGWEGV